MINIVRSNLNSTKNIKINIISIKFVFSFTMAVESQDAAGDFALLGLPCFFCKQVIRFFMLPVHEASTHINPRATSPRSHSCLPCTAPPRPSLSLLPLPLPQRVASVPAPPDPPHPSLASQALASRSSCTLTSFASLPNRKAGLKHASPRGDMDPDDEPSAQRKAVDLHQSRDTEPVSAPACTRRAAPRVLSYGGDDPVASASASTQRCASFPQRHGHGETALATAASFAAWVDGGSASPSPSAVAAALERAMSQYGGALPEFVGAGGGEGIFRVPLRAAMHPARPPALEVRPHPLRETQVGAFLRTLACDPRRRQLWAGAESGVRVWDLHEAFSGWRPGAGPRRRGDEDAAPFRESVPVPPALCAAVDGASGMVWTGHRDGRIRAWRMDHAAPSPAGGDTAGTTPMFKEALAWQAYSRTPVLAIVVTSYGNKLCLLDHLVVLRSVDCF